jgi:hypothetical protein
MLCCNLYIYIYTHNHNYSYLNFTYFELKMKKKIPTNKIILTVKSILCIIHKNKMMKKKTLLIKFE